MAAISVLVSIALLTVLLSPVLTPSCMNPWSEAAAKAMLDTHGPDVATKLGREFFAAYDPVSNVDRMRERAATRCAVWQPTAEEVAERYTPGAPEKKWSVTRFVLYHNVVRFLRERWAGRTSESPRLRVLDVGKSEFLEPFNSLLNVTRSHFPETDLHHTPYATGSFDLVATDQVLEHTLVPHLIFLEIKRILRPGGIAIVTTVAHSPRHDQPGVFGDYWRFMKDGLLALSLPFSKVHMCGTWGNADVISLRAYEGGGSFAEQYAFREHFSELVRKNERNNPFLSWIIIEK